MARFVAYCVGQGNKLGGNLFRACGIETPRSKLFWPAVIVDANANGKGCEGII